MGVASYIIEYRLDKANDISNRLIHINVMLQQAKSLEKDFFMFETINPTFYEEKESKILDKHQENLKQVNKQLEALISAFQENDELVKVELLNVKEQVEQLGEDFDQLVNLTLQKGFKDWGVIGKMRQHVHDIEETKLSIDHAQMLMMRRHEKDYLLRKQPQYLNKLAKAIERFRQSIAHLPKSEAKTELLVNLTGYHTTFQQMVKLDETIGFKQSSGVKASLFKLNESISKNLAQAESKVESQMLEVRKNTTNFTIILTAIFIVLTLLAGTYVYQKLGKPIAKLSEAITQSIQSDFRANFSHGNVNGKDEIASLTHDITYLYEKVQTYTSEILLQKEEIMMQAGNLSKVNTQLEEKTENIMAKNHELAEKYDEIEKQKLQAEEDYKNIQFLTKIGQKVSAHLDIHLIVKEVYQHIHQLMSVDVFAVGLFQPEKNGLNFYGAEVHKDRLQNKVVPLDTRNSLAVWSLLHAEEIIIHNLDEEYQLYVSEKPDAIEGLNCKSLVYMPLYANKKTIGVMSIQSEQFKAYNKFQIDIFRNLANYVGIAVQNAKIYGKIEQQQHELQAANQEISKTNKTLTSSINYAKRLQQNILPDLQSIQKHIPESFILFKPRDKVSGDFYFFSEMECSKTGQKFCVLVAADCTGHGVRGAFTSMVGYSLLNTIINEKQITSPKDILNALNLSLSQTFRQEESSNRDGMDLAIAVIDIKQKKLYFGGAKSPLIYCQNDELFTIKGTAKSVGGISTKKRNIDYETHELDISVPTTIYLASDGYQDQFGGAECKKMSRRGFYELLESIHHKPVNEQKEFLDHYLEDWKHRTNQKQIDDILVMGFKLHLLN